MKTTATYRRAAVGLCSRAALCAAAAVVLCVCAVAPEQAAMADPPPYSCTPAPVRKAPAAYAPAVAAKHPYQGHRFGHRDRVILVADAYFHVFDYQVKDQFVFVGPPPAPQPGLVLGVTAKGQEVRGVPAGSPELLPPAAGGGTTEEDALPDAPVLGYESDAAPPAKLPGGAARSAAAELAKALAASCIECHQAGKRPRGDFVLFDAQARLAGGLDWKLIKDVTTPDARTKSPARMPPPKSGKPDVPAKARLEIARRAGGGAS